MDVGVRSPVTTVAAFAVSRGAITSPFFCNAEAPANCKNQPVNVVSVARPRACVQSLQAERLSQGTRYLEELQELTNTIHANTPSSKRAREMRTLGP